MYILDQKLDIKAKIVKFYEKKKLPESSYEFRAGKDLMQDIPKNTIERQIQFHQHFKSL